MCFSMFCFSWYYVACFIDGLEEIHVNASNYACFGVGYMFELQFVLLSKHVGEHI